MRLVRLRPQLLQISLETEPSLMKDYNLITEPFHFVQMMCAKEDRFPIFLAGFDEFQDGLGCSDIEAGGRLVKHNHIRVVNECSSNGNFLLHTGR